MPRIREQGVNSSPHRFIPDAGTTHNLVRLLWKEFFSLKRTFRTWKEKIRLGGWSQHRALLGMPEDHRINRKIPTS